MKEPVTAAHHRYSLHITATEELVSAVAMNKYTSLAPVAAVSRKSWCATTSTHGSPALPGETRDSRPDRRCRVWAEGAAAQA